ncbi:hypothetical protein D3C86_2185520 [compost metagenome]
MQNAACLEVLHFIEGIDSAQYVDLVLTSVLAADHQGQLHMRLDFGVAQAKDIDVFAAI